MPLVATTTGYQSPSALAWTPEQVQQVEATNRLKNIFSATFTATLKFTSGYEQDTRLSISSWLGSVFTDRLAALIAPELPVVTVYGPNQAVAAKQTAYAQSTLTRLLQALLGPTAKRVSWNGWATWKLYWSDALQRPALRLWGARDGEYAFYETDPRDPVAVQAIQFWYPSVVTRDGKAQTYYVCERQSLVDGALTIATTAYATRNGFPIGEPVPLTDAWPAGSLPPEPLVTLPEITLLLGTRVDNVDDGGDGTGDTDYTEALISLQLDIISLMTQRRVVIERLEMPQINLPAEYVDAAGNPQWQNITISLKQNGEETAGIKVWEWSGGLDDSKDQYALLKNELFMHIPISPILLGEGVGGNESGTAKSYDLRASSVAVAQRRANYQAPLLHVLQACQQLEAAYGTLVIPIIQTIELEWPSVEISDAHRDKEVELLERQVMLQELAGGARSRESVIEHLHPDPAACAVELTRLALSPAAE